MSRSISRVMILNHKHKSGIWAILVQTLFNGGAALGAGSAAIVWTVPRDETLHGLCSEIDLNLCQFPQKWKCCCCLSHKNSVSDCSRSQGSKFAQVGSFATNVKPNIFRPNQDQGGKLQVQNLLFSPQREDSKASLRALRRLTCVPCAALRCAAMKQMLKPLIFGLLGQKSQRRVCFRGRRTTTH